MEIISMKKVKIWLFPAMEMVAILPLKKTNIKGTPKNNKTNPFCRNSNGVREIRGNFHFSMWITLHFRFLFDADSDRYAFAFVSCPAHVHMCRDDIRQQL